MCVCSITLVGVVHHKKPSASRRQQLNLELQREAQRERDSRLGGKRGKRDTGRAGERRKGERTAPAMAVGAVSSSGCACETAAWQLVERSGGGGDCQPQQLRSRSTATSTPPAPSTPPSCTALPPLLTFSLLCLCLPLLSAPFL